MDWTQQFDDYCERTDFSLWSEPLNAVTNLAFIIAAVVMWRRAAGVPMARALSALLFGIGIASGLFHTLATAWASAADVLSILIFILVYLYAANRGYFGLSPVWAGAAVLAFFPYAAVLTPTFSALGFLGSSAGYAPIPVLILLYAWLLRTRAPDTARGMAIGAGILVVSITLRTLDEPLCEIWPYGTHFLWHSVNAIMLGWMIEVYRRHMLAGGQVAR
ncbi:MAG: ceramidase [Paracoccaceae bacterium]|nr:ceramidase [Paracoccaceae bacterium]